MPQITLRRIATIANRINKETGAEQRRRIGSLGLGGGHGNLALIPTVNVNIDAEPTKKVDALRNELLSRKTTIIRLMEIETRIRQGISRVQSTCGIADLLSERVMVTRQTQIVDELLDAVQNTVYDAGELNTLALETRKRLEKATQIGHGATLIQTPILNEKDRTELRTQRTQLRRRQIEIDDRLAELNANNSVDISEQDQDYLRSAGIM